MDFVQGRREGPYLYDMDGSKRLFNLHCNGGVFNLGHRHNELIELLKSALDEVDIGNHHLLSAERGKLAEMLAELSPGDLNYTVFSVGGGEAVDLAIKVARAHTGRTKIISVKGGYHGHTAYAMATGDEKYRRPFGPQLPGFIQIPFNDIEALRDSIDDYTAAVILETVPATLGMAIPAPDYLPMVREITAANNTLLISDEVQTGLGRTGKLWGYEHFNIIPDMVVVGKGLSGGIYPIAATILREPLEAVFHADPFIHISTFGGAEPGCRVARRVLEICSAPEFLARVNQLAGKFESLLTELLSQHNKFFRGFRQLGLMIGLGLADEDSGPVMTKAAFDNDLLMIYAGNDTRFCQLLAPLNISDEQLSELAVSLDKTFTDARRLRLLLEGKTKIENLWHGITGKHKP